MGEFRVGPFISKKRDGVDLDHVVTIELADLAREPDHVGRSVVAKEVSHLGIIESEASHTKTIRKGARVSAAG